MTNPPGEPRPDPSASQRENQTEQLHMPEMEMPEEYDGSGMPRINFLIDTPFAARFHQVREYWEATGQPLADVAMQALDHPEQRPYNEARARLEAILTELNVPEAELPAVRLWIMRLSAFARRGFSFEEM